MEPVCAEIFPGNSIDSSSHPAFIRDNDSGEWSQEARQFAVDQGIFTGSGNWVDGSPNFMWEDLLTREQCAQVLYRFARKFGLA